MTNASQRLPYSAVRNRDDDYFEGHPQPADILWLIEVADSSIAYDQSVKLPLYAANGVTDYWIFNLLDAVLECYSDPYQNPQKTWAYRSKRIYLPLSGAENSKRSHPENLEIRENSIL